MLTIMLMNHKPDALSDIANLLTENKINVIQVNSGSDDDNLLESQDIDAVIAADRDLPLIKKMVSAFPMINYALISSCDTTEFHEITEGYGFFMQLPPSLRQGDVDLMINNIKKIQSLSACKKGEGK